MKKIKEANKLINFIKKSPTSFHVVKNIKKTLLKNNFIELDEKKLWDLEKGKSYFLSKNNSALIAFKLGNKDLMDTGFKIVASHSDSPGFKIKPNAIINSNSYLKLNTEVYGGPILNTWFDRPLSIAGRVEIKGSSIFKNKTKFINIKKPLLIIPNLSIHQNRTVNKGIELNKQVDTLPLLTMINKKLENKNCLLNIIAKELNINAEEILDFELFLYEYEKGCITGLNKEFISASKLDNLQGTFSSLRGFLKSKNTEDTKLLVCFDNEEIGSTSKQGADSNMLLNCLERISLGLNKSREEFFPILYKSFMVSVDAAHAIHPNRPEKSDPTNKVLINSGIAIKLNANHNYSSDSPSISVFKELCKNHNIPIQSFVNHSNERGGSTIGPISSSHVDIKSIDLGVPLLAMHSIREFMGVKDHKSMIKLIYKFYETKQ